MSENLDFKEIIKFAGAYISICIGSGFATGQEIMQFFSAHGMISILSNLICMIMLAYCGAKLLEIGKTTELDSNNDIFTFLCGKWLGGFFKIFMPIFFFSVFVVMISGAGSSMNQYYGIDKNIGSLILAITCLVTVLLGMDKVLKILGHIGPIIVVIAIIVGVITISKNYENLYSTKEVISNLNIIKATDSWWLGGIIYGGLNLVVATPFLVGAGSTANNKTSCIWGGILGGTMFMFVAILLNMGILSDIQNVYNAEIPTLYMADKISPIVGTVFSVILIAGIYTTAVPLLWGVATSFAEEKSSKFVKIAIFCTIVGAVGGRLPFSTLVSIIYPISGIIGLIVTVAIFIRGIKTKTKTKINVNVEGE